MSYFGIDEYITCHSGGYNLVSFLGVSKLAIKKPDRDWMLSPRRYSVVAVVAVINLKAIINHRIRNTFWSF